MDVSVPAELSLVLGLRTFWNAYVHQVNLREFFWDRTQAHKSPAGKFITKFTELKKKKVVLRNLAQQ